MGTTAEKLQAVLDSKNAIKNALVEKGLDVTDSTPFSQYAEKIGEVSPLKKLLDAAKRTKFLFEEYQGTSVDEFIKYSDTENVVDTQSMFIDCDNIITIPLLDTGNVTQMYKMFHGCGSLETIPKLNTSKVTYMAYMFFSCSSLETIPDLDTSNVTNMNTMFYSCHNLETIEGLNLINCTNTNSMFTGCSKLTNLTLYNIKANLSLSNSPLLSQESLLHTIQELIDVGATRTLTLHADSKAILANIYVKPTGAAEEDEANPKVPFEVCESTTEGAMTINEYVTAKKGWTIS